MATGDNSGDLDRLEAKVEATRAELASVAGAVNGLTELVSDLVRRSSDDALAEQVRSAVAERVAHLESLVHERARGVEALMARQVGRVEESVTSRVEHLETAVSGGVERAGATVTERVGDIEFTVTDRVSRVEARITHYVEQVETSVIEHVGRIVEQLEALAVVVREQESTRARLETIDAALGAAQATAADVDAGVKAIADALIELPAIEQRLTGQVRKAIADLSNEINGLSGRVGEFGAGNEQLGDIVTVLAQIRAQQPQLSVRLDQLAADLADMSGKTVTPEAFAGMNERLDALVTAMRHVVASQADPRPQLDRIAAAVDELRSTPLPPPAIDIDLEPLRARLDALAEVAASVTPALDRLAELRDQPDSSLVSLTPVVDRLAIVLDGLSAMHGDVTTLAESISSLRADRAQLVQLTTETNDRLDRLATGMSELRSAVPEAAEPALHGEPAPEYLPKFDEMADLLEAVQAGVTGIHDRIDALDTQALGALHARLDAVAAQSEAGRHELVESVREVGATTASPTDDSGPKFDALTEQVASMASDVRSAIRATVGLGADVTALRTQLTDLASVVAQPQVRNEALGVASNTTDEPVQALSTSVRDLRAELHSLRAEVAKVGEVVGGLAVEVSQPARDDDDDAGHAIVTAAAAAMTRVEGRIDGEFDTVGRQMEALGTLLSQVIEALHRVESQMVGVDPVSDQMRTAADTVVESLRANVRQRDHRRTGPAPELGRDDQ